jgi:hypothetical protein
MQDIFMYFYVCVLRFGKFTSLLSPIDVFNFQKRFREFISKYILDRTLKTSHW